MKILVLVQVVTLILALGAGILAVRAQNAEIHNAQTEVIRLSNSRVQSRLEQCYLIRGLGYTAVPNRRRAVTRYFDKTPLANCVKYSHGK